MKIRPTWNPESEWCPAYRTFACFVLVTSATISLDRLSIRETSSSTTDLMRNRGSGDWLSVRLDDWWVSVEARYFDSEIYWVRLAIIPGSLDLIWTSEGVVVYGLQLSGKVSISKRICCLSSYERSLVWWWSLLSTIFWQRWRCVKCISSFGFALTWNRPPFFHMDVGRRCQRHFLDFLENQ